MRLIGPLAIPDPLESHEQWEKYHHQDLPSLSPRALRVEAWRCQAALSQLDPSAPDSSGDLEWDWLWARLEAIRAYL